MALSSPVSSRYAWAGSIMVSSFLLTTPLLHLQRPVLYVWINSVTAGLLALQLLLLLLPDILQAWGLMQLNIRKGDSLLLAPSSPAARSAARKRKTARPSILPPRQEQ